MTVFTKPVSEMKKKSSLDNPLLKAEQPAGTDVVVHAPIGPGGNKQARTVRDVNVEEQIKIRDRRMTSATTVCLFLVGLLVMSVGIMGGIYLYRCARKPMQRLRGLLTYPYDSTDGHHTFSHVDSLLPVGSPEMNAMEAQKTYNDLMAQSNEGAGPERRRGQFVHDFTINKTGIVDVDGKRCFVIPLDRDAVIFLPSFVLDMARRMTNKYTDVRVIVKTMKIQFPRLQDMSTLGERIARECNGMKTYSLVKANVGPVFKRSADIPVEFDDDMWKTMKIEIINFKEVERVEEEEKKAESNDVNGF